MTADELEALVVRCYEEGVPIGVVGRIFELDEDLLKETLGAFRVKRYGTDDESEYVEILKWEAIAKAREIIATGSAAEQKAILSTVLGKQFAMVARRTPESVRNSQDAVVDLMEAMRNGRPNATPKPSKFIARLADDASA